MGAIAARSDPFVATPTNERFIYMTPFRAEVEAVKLRLRTEVATIALDPDDGEYQTLLESITVQAYHGQNIVSTHALFNLIDDAFVNPVEHASNPRGRL